MLEEALGERREVLEIGRAAYTSFSDSFSDMSSSFSESSMYDARSSSDMTTMNFRPLFFFYERRRKLPRPALRRMCVRNSLECSTALCCRHHPRACKAVSAVSRK